MNHLQDKTVNASNKHCEHCWKQSPASHYVFVAESHLIIFLLSPHVVAHDEALELVTLSTGQQIEYDFRNGDLAYKLKQRLIPHILCSDTCIADLTKHRFVMTNDALQQTAVLDCSDKDLQLWDVVALDAAAIPSTRQTCSQCGRIFPNLHKEFTIRPIADCRILRGRQGTVVVPSGFELGQSDTTQKHPEGRFWFFKTGRDEDRSKYFCSDECVFLYAKEYNVLILYPNLIMKGYITMITPYTVEANQGLGCPYPFRPQKMMPLS